jgi:hypothetical protein
VKLRRNTNHIRPFHTVNLVNFWSTDHAVG